MQGITLVMGTVTDTTEVTAEMAMTAGTMAIPIATTLNDQKLRLGFRRWSRAKLRCRFGDRRISEIRAQKEHDAAPASRSIRNGRTYCDGHCNQSHCPMNP